MPTIVPAVLASSLEQFDTDLSRATQLPGVTRVQIDVVDGLFASPPTWPYTVSKTIEDLIPKELPRIGSIVYEIDLMAFDPIQFAKEWVDRGATRLTFHYESTTRPHELLRDAHSYFGSIVAIGLALNATTDLELIAPLVDEIEYLQCMGIAHIGRQGEPFDWQTLRKVQRARLRYPQLPVQVDGGVSLENAKDLMAAGASTLVVGSALLRASDPIGALTAFHALESPYGV